MNWVITSLSDFNNGLGHSICSTLNKAVFEARMMQAMYKPEMIHNDETICRQSMERRSMKQTVRVTEWKLLPNPAKDWTWLLHPVADDTVIELYRMDGGVIKSIQIKPGSRKSLIPLDGLSGGIYIVRATNGGVTLYTGKLIVNL